MSWNLNMSDELFDLDEAINLLREGADLSTDEIIEWLATGHIKRLDTNE